MKRRDMLALAGGSLTLAIAGCSGDDGDDDNETTDDGAEDDDEETMGTASFELSGPNPSEATVAIGTDVAVGVDVTNTGDAEGETTVQFRIDGQLQDSQEVELEAGGSVTVEFTVSTADLEPGDLSFTLSAGESEVSGTLTLESPEPASFDVANLDPVSATVNIGTTLTVSAEITNSGGATATKTVELRLGGSTVDSQELELEGGATQSVSFDVDTTDLDAGEFTHSIWTEDDEEEGTLTLEVAETQVGTLLLNAIDAEELPVEGAVVSGEGIDGETDANGQYQQELEVGEYLVTVTSGELEASTTVEIVADQTTEVTVELLPDTSDLPAIDGFSGDNTGGFISFDEDDESTAREEGLSFDEGSVQIEATVENGTWESTSTNFDPLQTDSGVQAQTTAPNGLTGELDRENDFMTAEGTLQVDVEGETFSFEISMTTETSGALEGDADLGAESGTATIVDNEYTVEDTTGDAIIDSVLGLPIEEPGRAWVELIFDLQFQTAE